MKIQFLPCILFLSLCAVGAGAAGDPERSVAPIGPGSPSSSDILLAEALGIPLQRSYVRTRKALIRLGWAPELTSDPSAEAAPFSNYPEIFCGSGMDAICSARFARSGLAVVVIVDQSKGNLPVVHMFED